MFRRITAVGAACALSASAFGAGTLVSHWKFNEAPGASTAADSGPGGTAGTLMGGAAFVGGGIAGNAISLARATGGFVDMGSILPFTGVAFSVSVWIKTPSAQYDQVVGRHDAGFANGYFLSINSGSGYGAPSKAHSYVSSGPGGEAISVTNVIDNQWRHLVLTCAPGGFTTIFVNGKREATRPTGGVSANTVAFLVGGITVSGVKTPSYTGLADDLQVYSGALNGRQVCAMFNNPGQAAPAFCDGDSNGDNLVNFFDLNAVLSAFGQNGFCLSADMDGDGAVNFPDLNIVLSAFGQNC